MYNIFNIFPGLMNLKGMNKSQDMNVLTANDYYDRLKLIALSLFEWEGFPDSCNIRFLELTLFLYGRALFIYDDTLGFLNMKCSPSGQLNNYDEPISFRAFSTIYNKDFKRENCVLIRNNYLEKSTDLTVMLFASRLTEAERTIDTNIKAQKTPVLVRCDEKDRLTILNLYKKYEGNEPFILGGKALNPEGLKVLKTEAPFVADKLQTYKHEIWNEALTFFGINNANSDKKERLITDEVNANNEVIGVNGQAMLITRQEACFWINEKYNLNVSVKMRDFKGQNETAEKNNEEGGNAENE